MKKILITLLLTAVLFSSLVLAAGKQQPGSQGVYLGGAEDNFFGNYAPSVLTGYAVNVPVLKKLEEESKSLQTKVVKGDRFLDVGKVLTSKDGSLKVTYQEENSDSVTLVVKVSKSKLKPVFSMNIGSLNLLFKQTNNKGVKTLNLIVPGSVKDYTIESGFVNTPALSDVDSSGISNMGFSSINNK